jgi:hypothetical protein
MLSGRLVALIEAHAEELADRVQRTLSEDRRTSAYHDLPEAEVRARALRVFSHLGSWLEQSSDQAVEKEYVELGRVRRLEGIPLSEVVMALLLTRRVLWQFVDSQPADTVLEVRLQLDLELLVVRFFDRAVYHAVRGYESAAVPAHR